MKLVDKLYRVFTHQIPLPVRSVLLVAVSGGVDSLVLLHALRGVAVRLNVHMHVATFDHRLRGQAGEADAGFVVETCGAWGIPVMAGHAPEDAYGSAGIEATARRLRYTFLAATARQLSATYVVTAHHAGDQAETVLMHILRGAGLAGLRGMSLLSPLPGAPDLMLARPLLGVTRGEIEAYSRAHGLAPRHDATNDDTSYLRNRLRHEILPILGTVNPQIERTLGQLADMARLENDYLVQETETFVARYGAGTEGRVRFVRAAFAALHPALQRRAVVWAMAQTGIDGLEADYGHVMEAVSLVSRGAVGARALLGRGAQLRIDYQHVVIEHETVADDTGARLMPADAEIPVAVPGVTQVGAWVLHVTADAPDDPYARLAIPVGSHAVLRTRRSGDRFEPCGLGGRGKALNAWMIDRKIPQVLRERLPLLIINDKIAAVLYGDVWAISDRFAVREQGVPVYALSWQDTGS
jgi:tRNA(Ile)-lysidine synthase